MFTPNMILTKRAERSKIIEKRREKLIPPRKFTFFFVNTKNISSHVLKISAMSLVLRNREISDIFNAFDEIYLVFTSKK